MANRFSTAIYPSSYQKKPIDAIMAIGMAKDKMYQDEVDQLKQTVNTISNYNTYYNRDTQYKLERNKQLNESLMEHAKGDLTDPMVRNRLHQDIYDYVNDPMVQGSISRYNAASNLIEQKNKLGDKWNADNAYDFLESGKRYEETGADEDALFLQKPYMIDPNYDWQEPFLKAVDQMDTSGGEYLSGNYIVGDTGKSAARIQNLFTLMNKENPKALQQMQRSYKAAMGSMEGFEDYAGTLANNYGINLASNIHTIKPDNTNLGWTKFAASQAAMNPQTGFSELSSSPVKIDTNSLYKMFDLPDNPTTGMRGDPEFKVKYNKMIELSKTLAQKAFDNYSDADKNNILDQYGLDVVDGKVQGKNKAFESFIQDAFNNSNTSLFTNFGTDFIDPTKQTVLIKNLIGNAGANKAQAALDGKQAKGEEIRNLFGQIDPTKISSLTFLPINPNINGNPGFDITVQGEKGKPAQTFSVSVPEDSKGYFGEMTKVYQGLQNKKLGEEFELNSQKGSDNSTYTSYGLNTIQLDDQGKPYINSEIITKKDGKDPKSSNFRSTYDEQGNLIPGLLDQGTMNFYNSSIFDRYRYRVPTKETEVDDSYN